MNIKSTIIAFVIFFSLGPISLFAKDLIITNGKVWTGNDAQPWAEAVAIRKERIVAVGSTDLLLSNFPDADIIDVKQQLVLPGFIDNHVHFLDGSAGLISIKTQKAKSRAEFIKIVEEFADKTPKGEWILGGVWDHEAWGGILPQKEWIDQYTSDNPVYLLRTDGHMALANSKALQIAGITKDTPDPEGGVIVRNQQGEPTGVLKDNAMQLVSAKYPAPSEEKVTQLFDAGIQEALENGVTQFHHMDMTWWDGLPIFKKAKAEGRLKVRTYYYSHISKRHELAQMIEKEGNGDNWLRFGGVKVQADGALGSGTAWFYQPYTDAPENNGFPLLPMDELKVLLQESLDYGFQLAIHGIGDQTNDEVLRLIDEIGAKGSRPRIEHAQHLTPQAFKKFKQLGVIAAVHPYHVVDDGRFAEKRIGKERLSGIYAFKSLFDAGAKVSFGSDWFVAPLKPLYGIYAATTRRTADGKNPDGWIPEQRISVEQAVKAYTINNAWAGKQEDDLGSIEVGKLADIVVINDNIFTIAPEKIIDSKVVMTIIGGQIMYQAK